MNDPSMESYCSFLYDFFYFSKESRDFFDVSSLSVTLINFALWCYSTPFDAIPRDAENQIRNCFLHVGACSELFEVWQWFRHFLLVHDLTYVPFLPHFLMTILGPAHPLLYVITNLQVAITFESLIRLI